MGNRLDKLRFIYSISNNILDKKNVTNYTSNEYKNFCDLTSTFCYLLMFPENLRLNNIEEIEKICTQGKFYNRIYLKGTLEFENLKNKYPSMLKSLENDNVFVVKRGGGDLHYDINAVYEKKDDVIYEYYQFVFREENKAKVVNKEKGYSFEFPSLIRGQKRLDFLNNPKTIKIDDNKYRVALNSLITHVNSGKKEIKTIQIDYVDYDNCLVFRDFFDSTYSEYKNFENIFNKMVVVGAVEGNLFVLNNWSPSSVFHAMRIALAHNPKFNYNIKLNDYVSLIGKVLITNEKNPDNKSQHFNRILLLDSGVFHHISYLGNIDDAIVEDDTFDSIYVPSVSQNSIDLDEFLDKCAYITIKFENKINKKYATCLIDDILSRNAKNRVTDGIQENLKIALEKRGFLAEVCANKLKNKEFIKVLLSEQENLIGKNEKQAKKFEKYLVNLLNFYDYKSLVNNNYLIRKLGDTNSLKINNISIIKIMTYFQDYIVGKSNAKKDDKNDEYLFTKREMLFVFAYFYAFVVLIDNCFVEHLTNNVKKTVEIIDKTDFSKFEIMHLKDGVFEQGVPTTLEDKIDVMKFIRNCIAHANMFVELSKTGKAEEATIVFKNLRYRDKFLKININDFLNFLTNEDFINYSAFKDDEIEAKSFEDLLGKIKDIVKHSKYYIFD